MKIASIVSPDRVSIASFLTFMRKCLGNDYVFGEMHSLMSDEDISNYIVDLMSIKDSILFSYYAKKKINVDPLSVIPSKLLEISDLLVWMDLYSMDWKIIKDTEGVSESFIERWNKNIKRMTEPI